MVKRSDFERINDYLFEVPKSYRPDMRVPARFYADDELMQGALGDKSLQQLVNTATVDINWSTVNQMPTPGGDQ